MAAVRIALLLAAVLLVTVRAQPLFRSAVDMVTIPVVVETKDAFRSTGVLGVADFRVYENGVRQEITVVSHEPRALSICILVDSSPSMASGRQPLAIRAVDTLLGGLGPADEASLHFFAAKVRTMFPWTRGADLKPVSWLEWRLALGTALIDALREAFIQIEGAGNPLPVILVISDGGENVSGTSLPKLVATRRQSETLIYGIQTDLAPSRFAPRVNRAFTNFLPQVVGDSGGMVQRVASPEEAQRAAEVLLRELRSQYTIGYVPKRALDGTYRTLKVEPNDPDLTLRHRAGYLAATPER